MRYVVAEGYGMISRLRHYNEQLADFLDRKSSVPILLVDESLRIADCNNGFLKLFSLSDKPHSADLTDFLTADSGSVLFEAGDQNFTCNPRTGVHGVLLAHRLPQQNGLLLWCERPFTTNNQVVERMSFLNNEFIAMQRELDKKNHHLNRVGQELAQKVIQLEAALAQVKGLEGIIHICMFCKKIRDEEELWHGLELYISEHSDAEFSHGICPVCFNERFGEETVQQN